MNRKIFDDYGDLRDCNSCANYWDDTCDGATFPKPCNSYKACRKEDIPEQLALLKNQLDDLQDGLSWLRIIFYAYAILNALTWLIN